MKKKSILIIIVLLILNVFSSCGEDCPTRQVEQWTGGYWKLVKVVRTTISDFENLKTDTIDYSKNDVIYEFQCQENYKKVDFHWTPKFKLIIHNYISSGFPNDIQEGGEHFYQFRQPSDYFLPDCSHIDYNSNLKIEDMNFLCRGRDHMDIGISDDSMIIFTGQIHQFIDEHGNEVRWEKHFVRIKNMEDR
ncbi:hypothetical protein SDC9_88994 [bioreactor metagenome]|uniref:Lipocalin-like domain-containing protein n=1 Tax=bioreactor metagenome TaxID=1076179 RepID=A0A644ZN07_9ZZZZ